MFHSFWLVSTNLDICKVMVLHFYGACASFFYLDFLVLFSKSGSDTHFYHRSGANPGQSCLQPCSLLSVGQVISFICCILFSLYYCHTTSYFRYLCSCHATKWGMAGCYVTVAIEHYYKNVLYYSTMVTSCR